MLTITCHYERRGAKSNNLLIVTLFKIHQETKRLPRRLSSPRNDRTEESTLLVPSP